MSGERRAWPWLFGALVGALVVFTVGCRPESSTPPELAGPGVQRAEPVTMPAGPGVVPIALRIPSIKVDASDWQMVGVNKDQVVEVPSVNTPQRLGLYCPTWKASKENCGAPIPGARGPAVVLGHINGGGKAGVFAHLAEVKPGAAVEVDRSDGQMVKFRVTEVLIVDKEKFPTMKIYGDTAGSEIRLVTCGPAKLDRANNRYEDQTIVFGTLEQSPSE